MKQRANVCTYFIKNIIDELTLFINVSKQESSQVHCSVTGLCVIAFLVMLFLAFFMVVIHYDLMLVRSPSAGEKTIKIIQGRSLRNAFIIAVQVYVTE